MLAHNGHIETFYEIRDKILERLEASQSRSIQGDTDTEHFFHLLLHNHKQAPDKDPLDVIRHTVREVQDLSASIDPNAEVALNILWATDRRLIGCRLNRGLHYIERETPHTCEICDSTHLVDPPKQDYYSIEFASEPLTRDDGWKEFENGTVFAAGPDQKLQIESL